MKKLFENPVISSVELTSEDVIMASVQLTGNKFNTVDGFADNSAAADIWKGADEAWV